MLRRATISLVMATSLVSHGHACPTAYTALFELGLGWARQKEGTEPLRFFIGEVIVFNTKIDQPTVMMKVLRDYSAPGSSSKLGLAMPQVANMKIKPIDRCTRYELAEGQVGVYAAYEKDGELWLAWRAGPGF
jgi:hypothetical protein